MLSLLMGCVSGKKGSLTVNLSPVWISTFFSGSVLVGGGLVESDPLVRMTISGYSLRISRAMVLMKRMSSPSSVPSSFMIALQAGHLQM